MEMVNMLQDEMLIIGGITFGLDFFLIAIVVIAFFSRPRLTQITVNRINKTINKLNHN